MNTRSDLRRTPRDPYEREYLDWYQRKIIAPGMPFDPSAMVALARAQWTGRPELAEAFERCTRQWSESDLYTYFAHPQKRHSRIRATLPLQCPVLGGLFVDVDERGEIAGIEFLDRVMGDKVDVGKWMVQFAALAKSRASN